MLLNQCREGRVLNLQAIHVSSRTLWNRFFPLLLDGFRESLACGVLPQSPHQATILLIFSFYPQSLIFVLYNWKTGEFFPAWIQLLYSDPHASIRTNNINSEYCGLSRSTRQECPLSLLLFALAIALRVNPNIKGIIENRVEIKMSLYTDDLLLYVTDLKSSAPVSVDMLNDFGRLSDYKLNLKKSELYPVNSSFVHVSSGSLPF